MPSFSPSLERALHQALSAANERHHEYATLEHLLLALLRESGSVAYQALRNLGLSHEAAVKDVLAIEVEKG